MAAEPMPAPTPSSGVRALVIVVVLVAALLRVWHSSFGLPYLHHYDEPQTVVSGLKILQTGDLNPHYFNYGSLPIYAGALVDVGNFFRLMGLHDGDPRRLRGLDEIQTGLDTGFNWDISHPSFYRWNRLLSALLGTLTVLLTFWLGRALIDEWAGLLAAVALAGLELHVASTSVVIPDVFASFLALAAVCASLAFARRQRPGLLVLALAMTGLAASCKYNMVLVWVAPLLALLQSRLRRRTGYRTWLWGAMGLMPALAFLLGTPYALLDLPEFLRHAGYEVHHYKVAGHLRHTVEPGLSHALLQLTRMRDQLGWFVAPLAVLGTLGVLARRSGWLVLAFPVLYLWFMAGTVVDFHRNYLVLYPFAAVGFGAGAAALYHVLLTRLPWPSRREAAANGVILLFLGWSIVFTIGALRRERAVHAARETRSEAIDAANRLAAERGWEILGVAAELRVHPQDLQRLLLPYQVRPHAELVRGLPPNGGAITAARFAVSNASLREDLAREAERLNELTGQLQVAGRIEGANLRLNTLSIDPGVLILSR